MHVELSSTTEHKHGTGSKYRAGCTGCKALATEQRNRHAQRIAANLRDWNLRTKYGITQSDFVAMLLEQDGLCAVCHGEPLQGVLHVDHDHATGKVRGLLCENCNRGLGLFQDNPHLLANAASYLTEN